VFDLDMGVFTKLVNLKMKFALAAVQSEGWFGLLNGREGSCMPESSESILYQTSTFYHRLLGL